jgi:hypothetical protein
MAAVEPGPLELTQLDEDGPAHVFVRVEPTVAAPLGPLSGGIGEPQCTSARGETMTKDRLPSLRGELGLLPSL